jgi:hypothetical protein
MYRNGNAVEFGGLHGMGLSELNTQVLKHLTPDSIRHTNPEASIA